ncbi:hypothetical protein CBM2634_B170288 [Cupriavidus taiwanensis]|uniref:Uncharacterized protein n=1 Tax=Cupriavidus taiwanensis TaxID=164546 RepID=A0A375J8Q3_9BURK|nr:hypothetical protein CBM2634_B170288 [Cupriavidus taiwanensis]
MTLGSGYGRIVLRATQPRRPLVPEASRHVTKATQHTRFRRPPAAAQTHVENSDVISTESVDILPCPVRKPRSVRHRTGLPKI